MIDRRKFILASAALLLVTACSKNDNDDKIPNPIKTAGQPDDDDKLFQDDISAGDYTAQVVKFRQGEFQNQVTFTPDATDFSNASKSSETHGVGNGNRQAFRLRPRFGYVGQTAVVVFSDAPTQGFRVKLHYANRINSGNGRGFVLRLGSMQDFFCHSPFGRHPRVCTVYY